MDALDELVPAAGNEPDNSFLPVYMFGTTHVGSYEPGCRLPMRFRYFDTISPSQNFLMLTG
ncbi:hypothetical protein DIU31_028340 [Mucilaginibacter rubeus]|uniref:Uncharacterized protein n=1 Tax=Mucilaginibacter rubeus TaxID=2027860 RepID=A0AAE6MKV1_9SPHI|nr:hypothetical protein [Mucilaginibacter rubeus]QEM07218.1 hypothetical protein DIU31_028340 [Mucilaginibacter rubeus]QTE43629.1 hypothetical protein J3L19_32710 [Mucilaginibacter rubeus]QTE50229.1 hypothetical protein J3L21_32665 [Mucilaginibacter rubeus]QTE55317.1 hypothetical protein J3L23_24285 [Mucilaginibacter rubeus]QTE65224.1 hypothetical protein J3L22_09540 [Mucilaginibacter rubeus]